MEQQRSWSPLISSIIPVYNGERFLAETILSARDQTYRPLEIIVVDDGSTDGSGRIAKSFTGIQYIYQSNQGHAAAMNTGLGVSRGELIAFLDADDLWTPNKLTVQTEYLWRHPDTDVVFSQMQNFLDPERVSCPPSSMDLQPGATHVLCLSSALIRRSAFDRYGMFDETYSHAKDVEWFARATERGMEFATIPEIGILRRLHDTNRSYRQGPRTTEFLRVFKSAIERKRALAAGQKSD